MSLSGHSMSSNFRSKFLPPIKLGHSGDAANDSGPDNEKPGNVKSGSNTNAGKQPAQPSRPTPVPRRFLTPAEYTIIAHGIGGVRDHEGQGPVHPTSSVWPPKGLPDGLYRDVIYQRTKFSYSYHFVSMVRWIGVVAQLFIGATLTALGSLSAQHGTAITIMAAANTIQSGILALLQNSGLPDRYRSDKQEFERVEDHLKEILDTGLVRADQTLGQVLADCFERYQLAKKTTQENIPTKYTSGSALQGGGGQAGGGSAPQQSTQGQHGPNPPGTPAGPVSKAPGGPSSEKAGNASSDVRAEPTSEPGHGS